MTTAPSRLLNQYNPRSNTRPAISVITARHNSQDPLLNVVGDDDVGVGEEAIFPVAVICLVLVMVISTSFVSVSVFDMGLDVHPADEIATLGEFVADVAVAIVLVVFTVATWVE